MPKENNKTIEVVEDIQKLIINGELNPGDKLEPLRELADKYHTSRSVINSAIHILTTKGYLKIKPRHYVQVNDFLYSGSLDIMKDIYFESNEKLKSKITKETLNIRLLAEIDAINQIINNNFSLDKLKDVLLKEKNVIKNELIDIEEMVLLDCEFHETLVKSSGNTVLFLLFMAFKEIELDLVRKFYNSRSRFKKVVQIHDELVLLIENKNKDKAIEIWDKLLKQGAEVVLSEL